MAETNCQLSRRGQQCCQNVFSPLLSDENRVYWLVRQPWHVRTSVVVSVVVLVSYWLSSVFSVSAGRTSLPGFRKVRIIINNLRLIRIIDKYLMIIIIEHDAASLYRSDRFNLKRVSCLYVGQLKTPARRHVGCERTVIQLDNSANLRGICVTRVTSHILLPPCGQTTVNKKAPIHYIISVNDKVYRPL